MKKGGWKDICLVRYDNFVLPYMPWSPLTLG